MALKGAAQSAQEAAERTAGTAAANDTTTGQKAVKAAHSGPEKGYQAFVYIGPSLPNGRLKRNTVLNGDISQVKDYLADVLAEYPQVERLIIPTNRLAEIGPKVKVPGNIVNKLFVDVLSAAAGKKEE